MKLNNFFENVKTGSGFQEPSESGCLGKQIKKGKAKKSESKLNEYKYYMVKGPKGFNEKILAGSESDAKTKARHLAYRQGKASAGASRFSGTSDSDFEIVESIVAEAISVSDDMIGAPDNYYDAEERQEAHDDLLDALDDCRADHEKVDVMHGSCPNCSGTGYQDAEYPEYDDDGEEIEDSAFECDGWGMYGCDDGEMMGASWVDIIKHDERKAEREKAKADYPGDDEVIDQIARAVKQLDDPRQMFQYMKADYPNMGTAQRSDLIAKGMKKAGLTSEGITEGEERSIIADACVEKLVDEFGGRENQFANKEDFEYAIYQSLEDLDVEDCVDPDMEVGGQRIGDFASGRVIDCCSSSSIIYDIMANMDETQIGEGRIEDTFGTDTVDKHDKPKKKKKDNKEMEEDKELDSNEAMVSKMIAKALGDENRWSEMTPHELYAELESEKPEVADVIKLTAKMLYDVRLAENTKKDVYEEITLDEDQDFHEEFGILGFSIDENDMFEAEYQGRKVKLNKPMRGDVKKFKVYVKDPKTGNVKKVNFGHGGTSAKRKTMRIRKSNPKARKSFRARHNCDNPGPKTKARYWSCRKW